MKAKRLIVNVFLVLSFAFFLLSLHYVFFVDNKEDSFIFGYKPFIILSASMEPSYPVNSLVVIKKDNPINVKAGDTIAFTADAIDGGNAFHRVVSVVDNGFITKGDNNGQADQFIATYGNYIGSEAFHTNLTVHLVRLFSSPKLLLLYLALPVFSIFLIAFSLRMMMVQKKKHPPY